jgi:hypothetical protein
MLDKKIKKTRRLVRVFPVLVTALAGACASTTTDGFDPNADGGLGGGADGGGAPNEGGGGSSPGQDGGTGPSNTMNDGGVSMNDATPPVPDGGQPPLTCGGAVCHPGQTCVNGACEYVGCQGTKVPGDYATIQGAMNALGSIGGTICLQSMTYSENVDTSNTKPIAILGLSADATQIRGQSPDIGAAACA